MADSRDALQVQGLTPYRNTALSNSDQAVKASAGRLYTYHIQNPNFDSDVFVHLYDASTASVTVGTTTPTWTWWIPAGGAVDGVWPVPLIFATAITVAAVTTLTGSVAPTSGVLVNLGYV